MELRVIYVLLAYTMLREIIFNYSLNKLINKLMSRNYHEYEAASHVSAKKRIEIKVPQDPVEDLGVLGGSPLM